jgi:hypothetical protein
MVQPFDEIIVSTFDMIVSRTLGIEPAMMPPELPEIERDSRFLFCLAPPFAAFCFAATKPSKKR